MRGPGAAASFGNSNLSLSYTTPWLTSIAAGVPPSQAQVGHQAPHVTLGVLSTVVWP